jgi:hypothetical protein
MNLMQYQATSGDYYPLGSPLFHPYRIFQLALIAILMVGLIGKSSRTQAFVVITYAVIELAANIVARTELGALAPI